MDCPITAQRIPIPTKNRAHGNDRERIPQNNSQRLEAVGQQAAEIIPIGHRVLVAPQRSPRRPQPEAGQRQQAETQQRDEQHHQAADHELRQRLRVPKGRSRTGRPADIESLGRRGAGRWRWRRRLLLAGSRNWLPIGRVGIERLVPIQFHGPHWSARRVLEPCRLRSSFSFRGRRVRFRSPKQANEVQIAKVLAANGHDDSDRVSVGSACSQTARGEPPASAGGAERRRGGVRGGFPSPRKRMAGIAPAIPVITPWGKHPAFRESRGDCSPRGGGRMRGAFSTGC